jgi:hypothetical protein
MSARDSYRFVTPSLQLVADWAQPREVPRSVEAAIRDEVAQILRKTQPFLSGMVDVKVVSNDVHNYINIRVKNIHNHMIFFKEYLDARKARTVVCFYMSDKFEPYVIITILNQFGERVEAIEPRHVDYLVESIQEFKTKFGIQDEQYHYTGLAERKDTFGNTAVALHNKGHSMNFHVKMRIGTAMYVDQMPVMRLLSVGALKGLDPVRYNYSRTGVSWARVLQQIRRECGPEQ